MEVKISDFTIICRVCLKLPDQPVSISLFQIIEMMTTCTSVQIYANDNLPNQLCENCFIELQNSYNFKQLAERSDRNLRKLYEETQQYDDHRSELDDDNLDLESIKNEPNDNQSEDIKFERINEISKFEYESDEDTKPVEEEENKRIHLECDECDFTCEHLHHLGLHMKRYHQTKGMRCSKCNTLFYHPLQLKRHEDIQLCSKSKFCTECNTNFKTNNNLLKHSILVHGTDKPHKCFQCNKSFKLYTSLKLHDRSMHMRSNDVRTPCDICGKRILKREIKRHLKIHKNDREMIKCEQCDKKFLHQCSLKIHIQRFHENKPREYKHLCTICGKKFGTRCDLDRHGSVHRNDRPFECPQCGKGFKLNHNLKSHIKQIHMNMKKNNRIPCKVCGKMISKTNMKPHLQTHKAVRDIYNCTQCSKQFLHQLSLEQHIQKFHEKIVREFRHLCNMCGKGFNTRAELKIHMLSHSDEKTFACQTCNMKYKTMHGLRYHVKSVHLNLKPHPCPICSRHFSTRSVVERHMRTHTGERPFVCALCEKSFNQKSTLTTHMRLVHST